MKPLPCALRLMSSTDFSRYDPVTLIARESASPNSTPELMDKALRRLHDFLEWNTNSRNHAFIPIQLSFTSQSFDKLIINTHNQV